MIGITNRDDFWELCELSGQFRELTWLMESLEKFEEEYRSIETKKDNLLRNGIQKVLDWPKVIIFGCGDNGSGITSLLLRLNRNEIVCLSDNDEHKWNQNYMGIQVIPPMELKVDPETIVLIANRKYFYEIRVQLMDLGIPDRQIWLSPPIMRIRGTNILREGDILPLK